MKNRLLHSTTLGIVAAVLALGLLFSMALFPEYPWASGAIGLLLIAALAGIILKNRESLQGRALAYGTHSLITTLIVVAILGVANFLGYRNPGKLDLTKDKLHTLSDQTTKLVRELKSTVKLVYFAKVGQAEQGRTFLENYRRLNATRVEIEMVDPDKEPARAKQAGVRKYGTLQIVAGERDTQIDELTEEKLTNALVKITREKSTKLCVLTGHGEKSFSGNEADGFDAVRKGLLNQAYEVQDINLVTDGKVNESCSAIAIWGPTKAFFPQEIQLIRDYLANGGRAIVALDADIRGAETGAELAPILADWHLRLPKAMMVDPFSRVLNLDASVVILATFSKENAITKDFQLNAAFPLTRPVEMIANAPAGMNVQWLAKSTPKSWGEINFSEITKGQVAQNGGDLAGPMIAMASVEGKLKDSKSSRNTRLVVFGSSTFANNNYSRLVGNADLFLNAASWALEDESMISIRPKDATIGKVELTEKQGTLIFLLAVILMPLGIASGGIAFWAYRKRL